MNEFDVHKLVSIIIPTFNREYLLPETLDSILQQTYPYWECIIIDDGSTDSTVRVIQEYARKDKRFRLIQRNRSPKGAPTCRNIGIENIQGDYFMFLDSDDLLTEFCLEQRVNIAAKDSGVEAWVFSSRYFNEEQLLDKYFYFEDTIYDLGQAFLIRPQ